MKSGELQGLKSYTRDKIAYSNAVMVKQQSLRGWWEDHFLKHHKM